MKKQKSTADVVVPKKKIGFKTYMKKYWQLYVMLLFPLMYLAIFKYTPMSYIQIAFKKYKINKSIWEMPWADNAGFKYFIDAFSNPDFLDALRNTILLNLLDLVIGFSIPIIFALILNELVFKRFKRVVQTIAYMPHFLSWVIICGLALQMFAPTNGLVNMFLNNMGMETVHFLDDPVNWIFTYIFLGIWQSFGWNSIVYLAAIAGINPELYEAAEVDGAGRWRKIWHVTLPGIKSTIVILLIMNLGNILGSGFDRPYALQNNLVMEVAEVLSTFVYKNGILGLKFSLTTAIGFFQSIVCVVFLLVANWISRKMGERGIW